MTHFKTKEDFHKEAKRLYALIPEREYKAKLRALTVLNEITRTYCHEYENAEIVAKRDYATGNFETREDFKKEAECLYGAIPDAEYEEKLKGLVFLNEIVRANAVVYHAAL